MNKSQLFLLIILCLLILFFLRKNIKSENKAENCTIYSSYISHTGYYQIDSMYFKINDLNKINGIAVSMKNDPNRLDCLIKYKSEIKKGITYLVRFKPSYKNWGKMKMCKILYENKSQNNFNADIRNDITKNVKFFFLIDNNIEFNCQIRVIQLNEMTSQI